MIKTKPLYFSTLNKDDQESYLQYKEIFGYRSPRNKKYTNFKEIISLIQKFCIRNDSNDQYRCLVCGIFWIEKYLYINVNQLSHLIGKCKSSINSVLCKLGYKRKAKYNGKSYNKKTEEKNFSLCLHETSENIENPNSLIFKYIPFFDQNPNQTKGWTLRYRIECLPKNTENDNTFYFDNDNFKNLYEDDDIDDNCDIFSLLN